MFIRGQMALVWMAGPIGSGKYVLYARYRLRRYSGFTLIELLVVLAIIASLVTIVAPRYFRQIDQASEVVLRENLNAMRHALDLYLGDKGRYPVSLQELVDQHYLREIPMDPITGKSGTWVVVIEGEGAGVKDVHSGASGEGSNGTAYASW